MGRYGVFGERLLVNENDWSSWDDYFVNGSARIADAIDAEAKEMCDCFRPPGSRLTELALFKEHREFLLHDLQGHAPVKVSFQYSIKSPSVEESMLHKLIQLFACGQQHPDVVVLNVVVLQRPTPQFASMSMCKCRKAY